MKISLDVLTERNTISFAESDLSKRRDFFETLMELASKDLSLAHSVFKTNAANLILDLANRSRSRQIGAFSVYKSFDTVYFCKSKLYGKKHWISNLEQASYGIFQVKHGSDIQLCYVDLNNETEINRDFSFLKSPGLTDTCTGDIEFNKCSTEILFPKSDPKYFISNNFNSLCFIVNYFGAVTGLISHMPYAESARFKSIIKNLSQVLECEIAHKSFTTHSSDSFWHSRNSLYLNIKDLLVSVCQYIISNQAGNYYNLASPMGQHFYDCLIFSGHNGPISRNLTTMHTESQDL